MKNIFEIILEFFKNLFKKNEEPAETGATEPIIVTEPITESGETIVEEPKPKETFKHMIILLDNGHASSTPGKRSPVFEDGYQLREYEFNRAIVQRIAVSLDKLGIEYRIVTPEVDDDIKLTTRAARVNKFCDEFGTKNCFLISVHANAGSNGGWQSGRGWCVYTSKGQTKSDEYATIFFEEAEKVLPSYNMTLRKQMSDGDPDYEENFTIIYNTKCPAILTENLFMDNKIDAEFLRSEEGRDVIAQIHVEAIKRICKEAA